ncbi:cupin [Pseudoalteromonas luteoviolacea]|uniref:Cupin n=1 Tax=Pseudoalteromonas luteoviolacea TaxID=43657 RepID=A0A1C0TVL1_9GAMM|nr:cupin domain-containing protein [Pseudoalteromonas luteoviolacea]MBQ4809909.1 cupin domain-containing protein [Pseudoalteromonas luteoviolacea]OCQ23349.1 cupin [Pseudoalteromonas luteoviolacea]
MNKNSVINFVQKLALINEHWSPKVVAQLNDYQLKLVKVKGEFTWHRHVDTDELFLVIKGSMDIHFKDRVVPLTSGEMYVVKKGEEHKPVATDECHILIIEPSGVVNTGDAGGELTADNDIWI